MVVTVSRVMQRARWTVHPSFRSSRIWPSDRHAHGPKSADAALSAETLAKADGYGKGSVAPAIEPGSASSGRTKPYVPNRLEQNYVPIPILRSYRI